MTPCKDEGLPHYGWLLKPTYAEQQSSTPRCTLLITPPAVQSYSPPYVQGTNTTPHTYTPSTVAPSRTPTRPTHPTPPRPHHGSISRPTSTQPRDYHPRADSRLTCTNCMAISAAEMSQMLDRKINRLRYDLIQYFNSMFDRRTDMH